jgi:hypothetical protein
VGREVCFFTGYKNFEIPGAVDNEIRRPLLAKGHQAVENKAQSSIINPVHPFVHLSAYPHILNRMLSCLFPLAPGPQTPLPEQRHARLALLCGPQEPHKPCETSFKNWPGPPKTRGTSLRNWPRPPKTRGASSKSTKMAPQDGHVGPRWSKIARRSATDGQS